MNNPNIETEDLIMAIKESSMNRRITNVCFTIITITMLITVAIVAMWFAILT